MIGRYIHIIIIFPFEGEGAKRRVKERRSLSYITNSLPLIKGKGISPSPFQEGLTGEG